MKIETIGVPVAIFCYLRPDTLKRVIDSLRAVAPSELWFFVDFPAITDKAHLTMHQKVIECINNVNWPCKLVKRVNSINKGLVRQIQDGLDCFFTEHTKGLIIEDDIIISPSAAHYINKVIDQVDGKTIAGASLNNFVFNDGSEFPRILRAANRPYLSNLFHCWGWATTRAGWGLYNSSIEKEITEEFWNKPFALGGEARAPVDHWRAEVVPQLARGMQSWACRFQLSIWDRGAKMLVPPRNLAINYGWDDVAVHTKAAPAWVKKWQLEILEHELGGPAEISTDCDALEYRNLHGLRSFYKCRLCANESTEVFTGIILGFPRLYYECNVCGSLQTELPTWLDRSYSSSISSFDTGILLRNYANFYRTKHLVTKLKDPDGPIVIDFGAGTGMLTRMLRDTGVEAYAYEPLGTASLASGFQVSSMIDFINREKRPLIVTAFEVFEHFDNPALCFNELFSAQPDFVLFSTEVYSGQSSSWKYLMPESGQHVFFYSYKALNWIANTWGYKYYSCENEHLFVKDADLSNKNEASLSEEAILQILRESIYTNGGYGKFTEFLANTEGVMRDFQLLTEAYRKDAPLPEIRSERLYLTSPMSDKVFVDCIFFSMATTGIAKLWGEVLRIWAAKYSDRIVLIDRGGTIPEFGLPRIKFQPMQNNNYLGDQEKLTWLLAREGCKFFVSSYYTKAKHLKSRAVIYDMIPEILGDSNVVWDRKRNYLQSASGVHAISNTTAQLVSKFYPMLPVQVSYPGVSSVFRPLSKSEREEIRRLLGVDRRLFFILPCGLFGYKNGLHAIHACASLPYAAEIEIMLTVFPGDLDSLQLHFPELKLRSMRFASDEDYGKVVGAADLVLWPSTMEGMGFPPIEAICAQVPFAALRNDINLELYGSKFLLSEEATIDNFARTIDSNLNISIGPETSNYFRENFSYERYAESLYAFVIG